MNLIKSIIRGIDNLLENINKRKFLNNANAISEEFTTLPALAIVLFGIVIAFLLVGQTYGSYNEQTSLIDSLHSTENLYNKIIQQSNPFVIQSGIIDYEALYSSEGQQFIKDLQKQYSTIGLNFSIHFSFDNDSFWYPMPPVKTNHRIAVTHSIGLAVNMINTIDSTMSIAVWKINDEIP